MTDTVRPGAKTDKVAELSDILRVTKGTTTGEGPADTDRSVDIEAVIVLTKADTDIGKVLDSSNRTDESSAELTDKIAASRAAENDTNLTVQSIVDLAKSETDEADEIDVDASGFSGVLSTADDNVQKALDTTDAHTHPITEDVDYDGHGIDNVSGVQFASGSEVTWNDDFKTINIPTGLGPINQAGQETYVIFYNDSGEDIADSSILRPYQAVTIGSEEIPTLRKAKSDAHSTAEGTILMATMLVPDGTLGVATKFGRVSSVNTLGMNPGADLYISTITAGAFTDVRPEFPDYAIKIGGVLKVHETAGEIIFSQSTRIADTFHNCWDGCIRESINFYTDSDGVAITGSLTNKDPARDLTLIFSDGFTTFDTTPAATLVLTAGTDINPQTNYVFIDFATKTLQLSTSSWPTAEHVKVAEIALQSIATTKLKGAKRNQNWNDHIKSEGDNGHLLHITERLRQMNSQWDSGCEGSAIEAPAGADIYIKNTAGIVYQLHKQNFPILDMNPYVIDAVSQGSKTFTISDDGDLSSTFPNGRLIRVKNSTGNDRLYTVVSTVYSDPDFVITVSEAIPDATADGYIADDISIVNDFTTPYKSVSGFASITTDALGTSLVGRSFTVVVWGVMNKTNQACHLMGNVSAGTENTGGGAKMVEDSKNKSVYIIPKTFQGVGFLIARVTAINSGGILSVYDVEDLRGYVPNSSAGGGAGGTGVTTFLGLDDTPAAYTGFAGSEVRVNSTETALEVVLSKGDTASRPAANLIIGQFYFDTTLGIPIWHDGTNWIDATGTTV